MDALTKTEAIELLHAAKGLVDLIKQRRPGATLSVPEGEALLELVTVLDSDYISDPWLLRTAGITSAEIALLKARLHRYLNFAEN